MRSGMLQIAVLSVAICLPGTLDPQHPQKRISIPRDRLCVTEGTIASGEENQLEVDAPKMRAYVNAWTSEDATARFTYLGPSKEQSPLGSGEMRRQFGLKLRAQNACNLVYVMWRFEPKSRIVVSLKENPGQTTSAECGNRGYRNIKAERSHPAPAVRAGDAHELETAIGGTELVVRADGKEVWTGDVGSEAAKLNGPIGIRSDNVRLAFDLRAGQFAGPHPMNERACQQRAEE